MFRNVPRADEEAERRPELLARVAPTTRHALYLLDVLTVLSSSPSKPRYT
jgi:hypothetical protein